MFEKFFKSESGAIGVVFGFVLIMLLGFIGAAVDYGMAYSHRSTLQAAADSAALAVSHNLSRPTDQIEAAAQDYIDANAVLSPGVQLTGVDVTVLDRNTTVRVELNANVETSLLGVLGVTKFPVGVTSVASNPSEDLNIVFLIDSSISMGQPADPAIPPVSEYLPHRNQTCIFACHVESITARHGIETRFDVVKSALSRVIDDIGNNYTLRDRVRLGIYKFNSAVRRLYPHPSSSARTDKDRAAATDAVKNIHIDGYITPDYSRREAVWDNFDRRYVVGYSFLERSLESMRRELRKTKKRHKFETIFVMVSDGTNETHFTRRGETASTRNCRRIRNLGVEVYSIYLTSAFSNSEEFMRNCASSPGHMFTASDTDEINEAFDKLSSRLGKLRLTH